MKLTSGQTAVWRRASNPPSGLSILEEMDTFCSILCRTNYTKVHINYSLYWMFTWVQLLWLISYTIIMKSIVMLNR